MKFEAGDVRASIFPRSSVKSIQASAMVRNGLALDPRQLAVVCASHSGSEEHFKVIRSVLAGAGLSEEDLMNAQDKPLGTSENIAWGSKPASHIAQNCSGKHAGMLATCVVNGWDTKSYLDPSHPLQVAIKNEFETVSGEKINIATTDGCGAPLFAVSTRGLATGIHRLTVSSDPVHQQVLNACRLNPDMVAGTGRITTTMMEAVPGLFMKDGAEGVNIFSMPDGRTCAFKIADGATRPFAPIMKKVFSSWSIDAGIDDQKVMGGSEVVGEVRCALDL